MASLSDDYDFRSFTARLTDGVPDRATAAWIEAETFGFHSARLTPAQVAHAADYANRDDRAFDGAYAKHPIADSWDVSHPVATFGSFTRSLNLGDGRLVDAHLICAVTVSPAHRRRGILRRLMTDSLRTAADNGLAIAALTASEASIYRRFGFGPATRRRNVALDTRGNVELLTTPGGTVSIVDPAVLVEIAPEIFARFHARTVGSLDRQSSYWDRISGVRGEEGEPDLGIRALLYRSEDGTIDGYLSYRVKDVDGVSTLEIVDLVPATDEARLGLWNFVASIDLVDRVTDQHAPLDDPLSHALKNSRLLEVTHEADFVWFRILDPIAVLSTRPYIASDTVTLRIHDGLGYAEGTFRIEATGGSANVTRVAEGEADIELDAASLASLFLGGADAAALAAAGLIHEHTAGGIARVRALFLPERPIFGITQF